MMRSPGLLFRGKGIDDLSEKLTSPNSGERVPQAGFCRPSLNVSRSTARFLIFAFFSVEEVDAGYGKRSSFSFIPLSLSFCGVKVDPAMSTFRV